MRTSMHCMKLNMKNDHITIFGLQVLRVWMYIQHDILKGGAKKWNLYFFSPFLTLENQGWVWIFPQQYSGPIFGFGMRLGLSNLCLTFQFQWLNWSNLPSNSFLYKIQVKMALKLKISRKQMCTCLFLDFILDCS